MRRDGFSLIEISVVLAVVSTMLAGVLPAITESSKVRAVDETADRMETITNALQAYFSSVGELPCPAPVNATANAATFGVEDSGASCQAGAAATRYGVSGNVVGGSVPTKTLGLADEYAFDGWGRRIAYHVDHRATVAATFNSAGAIRINDDSGTARTTMGYYALISGGRNGHGAYLRSGSQFNAGSTNADEASNCANGGTVCTAAYDNIFVQKLEQADSGTVTDKFDDIVSYKLKGHLLTEGGGGDTLWSLLGNDIHNTNAGNVGIGTTSPTEKLSVGDYSARTALQISGLYSDPGLPGSSANGDRLLFYNNASWKTGIGFGTLNDVWVQATGGSPDPAFRVFTGINAGGAPSEKLRVTNEGNVGIGTSSPQAKLDVADKVWIRSGSGGGLPSGAGAGLKFEYSSISDTGNIIAFDYGAGLAKNLTLQSVGGNVGIGTNSPSAKLDVAGAIVSRPVNAGASTNINFALGNLVYSSAACSAITLSNILDGGVYSLVLTGSGTGPATFTHAGLTVRSAQTLTCTAARHTVFSFIRAGSNVYVTMIAGF